MSPVRDRNLFDPTSDKPSKLSSSDLELFMFCPRCFYIDRRLGVARVEGPACTFNTVVDCLLKKEFDIHHAEGKPHPLMREYGLDAVPFAHPDLEQWRENFVGMQHHHIASNLLVFGAIDDLWVTPDGTLIVVVYKATSVAEEVTLEGEWKGANKRQMEVYQWLFRRNGFVVENRGYFVYVNGDRDREAFDGRLEFDVRLLPYDGNDDWVEEAVQYAHDCLMDDEIPDGAEECEWCEYHACLQRIDRR